MRGTGAVVFFMLGVGLIYFAWNSGILNKLLTFTFAPWIGGNSGATQP